MSIHHLVISEDDTDREYRVDCPTGNGCAGWIECHEPHEVNGISATEGPDDADLTAPWSGEQEFEFHGQAHTWRPWHGWTVAYDGCPVIAFGDPDVPGAEKLPPGTYEIEDDWDDTSVLLDFTTKPPTSIEVPA